MKAIIIRDQNGDVLYVAKLEEIGELDFIKLSKEAKTNQGKLKEEKVDELAKIYHEIDGLNDDVKHLKGED